MFRILTRAIKEYVDQVGISSGRAIRPGVIHRGLRVEPLEERRLLSVNVLVSTST